MQTRALLFGLSLVAVLHLAVEFQAGNLGTGTVLMTMVAAASILGLLLTRKWDAFRGAVQLACSGLLLVAVEQQLHDHSGAVGLAWFLLVPLVACSLNTFRDGVLWAALSIVTGGLCLQLQSYGMPLDLTHPGDHGTLATVERSLPFAAAMLLVFGQMARLATMTAQLRDTERGAAAARREARTATRRLREEQKIRAGLLNTLDHTRRTPLTGIFGLATLLLQSRLDAEQRRMVEDLRTAATTLRSGLDQLGDLAHIASGELQIRHERVDLHAMLSEAIQPWVDSAEGRNVEVLVRLHPQAPRFLLGDEARIGRALGYLVRRAIENTVGGEVAVDVVPIAVDGARAALRFTVEDGEKHLDVAAQQRIFDAMLRGDALDVLDADPEQGGLALCRGLADAMNGETGFRAPDGKRGTRLWLTLPLPAAPDSRAPGLFAADFDGLRALVVHGADGPRRQIAEMLRGMGMSAVEADSCPEALNMLELSSDGERPFHLALIDERVLTSTLSALRETLEARPQLADTCLVLLTADADNGRRFLEAGVPAYLVKPVLPSALKDTVALAVGLRGATVRHAASPDAA